LIDFFRFNCYFTKELFRYQPISQRPNETLNLMRYMSLEGFVASISPFNFTAIAGNLAYTPTIMVSNVAVVYRGDILRRIKNPSVWQIPMFSQQIFAFRNMGRFCAKRL
jgi:hypothetical protein